MAMQLELGDQIPYADGSCDGSVSSIGTGSILGHSTSEEDLTASRERLWKYREEQQSTQEDHHSLNNILDTVTSSNTKLADLEDDELVDKLDRSTCSSTDVIRKDAVAPRDADVVDLGSPTKATRPTSLSLAKDLGCTSLASAYFSLSEQVSRKPPQMDSCQSHEEVVVCISHTRNHNTETGEHPVCGVG